MNDLWGETIHGYERHDLIGEGASGIVYRATDTHTGEAVAIKCLKAHHHASAATDLERFRREGELLRALDHPNIVKLLEVFEDHGQQFLVMEYVPGGSLRDVLTATPQLPLERVLWIALDLADALTRAHRLDVIHRDLKPENVLIAEDGTPRLTDFGIAQLVTQARLTGEGHLIGTPHYLSPEAIDGQRIDTRTDIWSFGVLLFEMLAGQVPFTGELLTQILYAIAHDPLPDLEVLRPDLPVGLIDLVYRMLEKDPGARLPNVRIVGTELDTLLRGDLRASVDIDLARYTLDDGDSVFRTPTTAIPTNLPAETTPFVGRETELRELARLIAHERTRLITILGPGGMGKTRLSLAAARQQLDNFERGVWFVELAPLREASVIVSAIAEALDFRFSAEGGEPRQQLLNYLRRKEMLLVLDNFEHILEGRDLVQAILETAPDVTVLVTSRARLSLSAETVFALSHMDFPDWETPEDALEYSAVKLFMQSAQRARPGFELVADDLRYVARICRLVAGMPLGIVLAAAWADQFSVGEIADELAQNLDFLETDLHDVPDRHRSVRAVFESALAQISASERDLFLRMSVFRGGFTRKATKAVTGAGLRDMTTLVNKSLLWRNPESGRYEVHELLRQFAAEARDVAGVADETRSSHSVYYLQALSDQLPDMRGSRPVEAADAIAADYDNVRAAWLWAVDHHDADAIERAWETLWDFMDLRTYYQPEHVALFERAAHTFEQDAPFIWAVCQLVINFLTAFKSAAQADLLRSVAILRDLDRPEELVIALIALARFNLDQGNPEEAKPYLDEALTLARSSASRWRLTQVLLNAGRYHVHLNELARARLYFEEALPVAEANDSRVGIAIVLSGLATTYLYEDANASRRYFQRALDMGRELKLEADYTVSNLNNWGLAALRWGAHDEAIPLLQEALALALEAGDKDMAAFPHSNLARVYIRLNDLARAQAHYVAGLRLFQKLNSLRVLRNELVPGAALRYALGNVVGAVELFGLHGENPHKDSLEEFEALRATLEAELSPDVYATAWARGQALDLEATVQQLIDEFSSPIETPAPDPIAAPRASAPSPDALSERELEILALLAEGLTNRQIAERLFISRGTVKAHAHNIFEKLGVNNRTQAVTRARQLGLLD